MSRALGILHVHSRYSYDGRHSLQEIADLAAIRKYAFVGITDHVERLTPRSVARLVEECRRLSTPSCRLLPGLEFSIPRGPHLLGFGLTRHTAARDACAVAGFIRQHGGLAVVAHPAAYPDGIPVALAPLLDGLEVWNARYDGRFAPDPRWWPLLESFRTHNPALHGFGGLDLHTIDPVAHVTTVVDAEDGSEPALLEALRAGRFTLGHRGLRLGADGGRTALQRLGMALGRRAYDLLRGARDGLRRGARDGADGETDRRAAGGRR
jgi:hypothetical protein